MNKYGLRRVIRFNRLNVYFKKELLFVLIFKLWK